MAKPDLGIIKCNQQSLKVFLAEFSRYAPTSLRIGNFTLTKNIPIANIKHYGPEKN